MYIISLTGWLMLGAVDSLPDHVVLSETINTFKSRLDKFWQYQNMINDF